MDNPKLKFLEDVPWDNSLRLSNGKTVHGLEQLPIIIKFSDDEVFASHVTNEKNDFANWIRDVIGDVELADKLLYIKTKDDFLKFMDQAIIEIKNYKAPEPVYSSTIQPIIQSVSQPEVQQVVQSVSQPAPVVQSIITPVIQQTVPAVVPNPAPVIVPVVAPVAAAVVASVSESVVISTPITSTSIVEPTQVPILAPQVASSETTNDIIEEIFDFEEIFKTLIVELDQEVLAWDAQTS